MPSPTSAHPPSAPIAPRPRTDAWIALALALVGTAICLIRVPAAHHGMVWGEDGYIFFGEYLELGPWASLIEGYAGYQHLVPRILASTILSIVPAASYAVVVFWVSSVIAGIVGAAVFWLSREIVTWLPARVALGVITFVLPLAAQEVIGNLADLHSYLMWLAPWLLLYRPKTWASSALWAAVAFLVAMTEVQAMMFLALVVFRMRRRDRLSWPVFGAFAIGVAWQLMTFFTVERAMGAQWPGFSSLFDGFLINVVTPMAVVHPDAVVAMLQSTGLVIPLLVSLILAGAAITALVLGTPQQRLMVTTVCVASAAIYTAGATADGSLWFRYADWGMDPWDRMINSRYGVSAGMLLVSVIPLACAALAERPWPRPRTARALRVVAWAALGVTVVGLSVASIPAWSARAADYPWAVSLAAAEQRCDGEDPALEIKLAIAPNRYMKIACGTVFPE